MCVFGDFFPAPTPPELERSHLFASKSSGLQFHTHRQMFIQVICVKIAVLFIY